MANPGNSRFRYIDAGELGDRAEDLDGIDVRNTADEKLGEVDGFIVDAASQRPYYVVVDAGGWFSGGRYLLPINHGKLVHDAKQDEDVLLVDLDKHAIGDYPKFDKEEFGRLSDTQVRDFETRIGQACCPDEAKRAGTDWSYDRWSHYGQPDWWSTGRTPIGQARDMPAARVAPGRSRAGEHDRIIAQEGQPVGDRAQPGNVLGIERGGEQTHLGDTAKDEDQRVEESDRESRKHERGSEGDSR
ncbi:MAG: PRC-barrel domain-containing protein [Bacteroidales bacterium]